MPAKAIKHREWKRRWLALALCGTTLFAGTGARAGQQAPEAPQSAQLSGENGEAIRSRGSAATFALTYNSDTNSDLDGGDGRGAAYLQRVGLIGDADLYRVLGWRGATAHVSLHLINGTGLSGRAGTLLPVSGIEAEPAARLFNLWIEQRLGAATTLRAGQFTAAQEFAVSPTAALFVNSTFGWPASFATDLPSGGPAYPLAAPGLRLAAAPFARTTLRVAIFAGDPAGPGTGDPQRRDLHGLNGLRFKGRPFLIAEIARSAGGADPAWTATLGGWLHTGRFDDLARDDRGVLLAAPGSSGDPFQHRGDSAIYAMVDARLWKSDTRTLRGFVRASASPADRNPIDRYLDVGLSLSSPLRGRPGDTFGVAFAVARISPRLRALRIAQAEAAGPTPALPRFEALAEASWQFSLSPRFYLQPNAQLILHPSAALLAGPIAPPLPSHALVLALRTSFRL
jgi:porin